MVGPDKMWQYTTGGSHCWAAVMLQSSKGLTTTQRAAASEKSGVGASTGRKMLQDNHCNWRAPLTPQYTKNPLPPYMISTVDKCYCFATLCRNEMLCGQTNDIFRMKTAYIMVYFGGDQNYCSTIVMLQKTLTKMNAYDASASHMYHYLIGNSVYPAHQMPKIGNMAICVWS